MPLKWLTFTTGASDATIARGAEYTREVVFTRTRFDTPPVVVSAYTTVPPKDFGASFKIAISSFPKDGSVASF